VELSAALLSGNPWEEIGKVAKTEHADLIVMGTHGRRGMARAILGSVAEQVIRTSTVPVLVVHGGETS
jgi:nucleotide-binding universal stress UspA family protein